MSRQAFKTALFACFLLCLNPGSARAQEGDLENLFSLIEARLAQPGGDTAHHFILEHVRQHCGTDKGCLVNTYKSLMQKLERRFKLPAAISVGGEIAKIARQQGDLSGEAWAHTNQSRYHSVMGNDRLATVHLEKALRLLEQTGDHSAALHAKASIVERGLGYRAIEEIVSEMEALLAQAVERKDSGNVTYLQLRLINLTKSAGQYDKMETYVSALEKFPLSNPIKANEYGEAIHAQLGRADLLMVQKNVVEAERFYQKALRLCEAEPSRWLEIQVLHTLAKLEWERRNARLAKSYLDSAHVKAEKLELHEHLAYNFELKAMIAEAEKRYADALDFTKKAQFQRAEFDKRGAGFNAENYYLQLEKDQLAAEKETQSLQLRLKNSQLRNSLLLSGLVLLLAAGLSIGLYKQRQAKNKLAAQNALIQQQSGQLRSLDAAKSRFFANVSHELRTPLTLLLGPIKTLLKENQLTEKQTRLLQMANHSGKELQQLVNEILDLQKLEVGKMELDEKPTALAPFFGRYAAQFESLAHRKELDFLFETTVGDEVVANIDQEKCRQIIYNLLSNAFKFTPAGGQIKVKLEIGKLEIARHGSTISQFPISNFQLTVSDSGPGIHPDDLPHVFDRFFQTTRPDKPAEGGTGIGLALCHEYAKLFGGKIEVESSPGKGSTFRVAFPVEAVGNPQVLSRELGMAVGSPQQDDLFVAVADEFVNENWPQSTSSKTKPTILVVEDNPQLQDYIRLILEEKYQVVTADNGQAALDCLLPTAYCQLILSDLMMPFMDGYQLLEKLKSDDATRHIPVIMLTARAEAKDRLKALRIGVDDYLTKPFDEEELLVRIENLLRNQAVRSQEAPADSGQEATLPILSDNDQVWLVAFETFIQENLSNDLLSIPRLAQQFTMSESTLLRQLKRLTGLSPQQYLTEMRLHEARHLLENRQFNSLSKVASEVGYADVRSFSRSFKGRFGKLPSEFLGE